MRQFTSSEVRYKDFRKTIVPKLDSARQDSFIHWYKLFCATCLQWGLWCPPYESVEQDNIHSSWWLVLPASVQAQDTFMSSLLYGALSQETVFPAGSREHSAVQGCAANAGYDAIYSLLRLHHPRLQAALHTVNEIPRQRRAELFSSYLRRLQDFMARERIAGRNYSEYEALNLSVRNLAAEWRSEFRRLVERDRRTGRTSDTLLFHLTMSQLATTFVQYSIKIGRDVTAPSPSTTRDRYSPSNQILRRIETAPLSSDALFGTADSLGEHKVDLLVRAMSHNQANSATCLGCHQTGHTLTDCNRFVDYIVAESLAQRHPQLKSQVATAHSHFCSRINIRNADGRSPPGIRTVRSILTRPTPDSVKVTDIQPSYAADDTTPDVAGEVEDAPDGYQLNALRGSFPESSDDFDLCFQAVDIQSCTTPDATTPFFESVCGDDVPFDVISDILSVDSDSFLFRRLSETYDPNSRAIYAHADNGSMACTTSDYSLLFSYRVLAGSNTKVRLFDAGSHSHHPDGVGFLCLPAFRIPPLALVNLMDVSGFTPCCVFVRTYHTASIPGVIISHCAIAKQLAIDGYSMHSSEDRIGLIRFPSRASAHPSADICISLQPTRLRGGLTFTDALLIPTSDAQVAPLPCGPHLFVVDPFTTVVAPPPAYYPSSCTTTLSAMAFPEFLDAPTSVVEQSFAINALGRSALRMLWHQRLCHLNFRRLSELHKHTRGMPARSLPDVIDECAVCMSSKLRKTSCGHANTMTATECLQGLGIDFAFMVQKSADSKRFDNLVGDNGETCYVLITDHFSGRLIGRAFATKAPPVDWLNQWLANNAPSCTWKYVRMDGGGELGRCREILDTFANFGYQTQLTGPDSSHQNGPGERPHQTIGDALRAMLTGASLRPAFWRTRSIILLSASWLPTVSSLPTADRPSLSPMNLEVTDDPFHRLDSITQAIKCDHPTLGFEISACHIHKRGYLSGIAPSTSAARIRNVRRKYMGAYIVSVDGTSVLSCESIVLALTSVAASDAASFTIVFAPDRYIPVNARPNDPHRLPLRSHRPGPRASSSPKCSSTGAPYRNHDARAPPTQPAPAHDTQSEYYRFWDRRRTRRKLQRLYNWKDWQLAEAKQLNSMAKQEMYGSAIYPPAGAIILQQHWNYSIKADGTRKARNCCDGSPRAAPALKLANTYSSCIEQPCMRMFIALCANEGYICIKVDATNAYANSPPPDQPTFVYIDQQYADWFLIRNGFNVPCDHVLPVQHALKGHPESGALWERFINKVLHRHGFKSTTHERSLYYGTYDGWKMLISRQVDDLAIGCRNVE
ncbi:Reverse transcriptase (RNA-dependent DNA polymerase) [Fragilaria crotonensis]|nr:Reverse transcriptase (RNA-dependent DNA polymerase) [Fragilaria crotonensis]